MHSIEFKFEICIISLCNTYNIDFGACRTHSFLIAIVIWLYVEGQLSACGTWAYRERTLCGGGLFKASWPVFKRVSEKTTKNSKRLGRQARLGFEPSIFRLPVSSVITPPLVGLGRFRIGLYNA